MRVLHVVPSYAPAYRYGGPIQSVHGLCKALVARGHEVHVFTTNVDGPGDLQVPLCVPVDLDGVQVSYFPSRRLRRLYWSPEMARALRAQMADFHLAHLHSIYLWPTWAAARAAWRSRVPYVLSPRGMLVRDLIHRKSRLAKSAWLWFVERRNLERAAVIHVTSSLEAMEARRFGLSLPVVVVVPNGVEVEDVGTATDGHLPLPPGIPEDKPLFVFLGRVNWKKGLDRLIPALAREPAAHLAIVGNDEEGYGPKLQALASELGVSHRVTFTGPLYGDAKVELLKRATALVAPSYSENFGNVVLEAMAAGCPVAVTPEVGVADTVRETGAGLVVDGTPEVLGRAFSDLLADPARNRKMGELGRKTVRERFAWPSVSERMAGVYRDIVESNGGGHAHA